MFKRHKYYYKTLQLKLPRDDSCYRNQVKFFTYGVLRSDLTIVNSTQLMAPQSNLLLGGDDNRLGQRNFVTNLFFSGMKIVNIPTLYCYDYNDIISRSQTDGLYRSLLQNIIWPLTN